MVDEIKRSVFEPVRQAWQEEERRKPSEGTKEGDVHPKNRETKDRFLFDVRLHLSVWPVVPWLILAGRNKRPRRKGNRS